MVTTSDDHEFLREVAQIMRNPALPHIDPVTGAELLLSELSYCEICTVPIQGTFSRCYQCNVIAGQCGDEFPDLVVPLTYAGSTGQSRRDVYKYKDDPPSDGGVRRLSILLYFFISRHSACLEKVSALPVDTVVTVPSSKGRIPHPLENFKIYFPERMSSVQARFIAPTRTARGEGIRSDDFQLSRSLDGEHVLVLEDSWVRGTNAVSLAVQAKRYGANRVTVLPLARYLNTEYSITKAWMGTGVADSPYDPDFCPVTRGACP